MAINVLLLCYLLYSYIETLTKILSHSIVKFIASFIKTLLIDS